MQLTLFTSGQTGNQTTTVYPNQVIVTDEQTLIQAVQFDHVTARYQNNTRSTTNFLQSDVVVMDIDNDHTENPDEWVTAEMLEELFDDYQFALATSRNHMLIKEQRQHGQNFTSIFLLNQSLILKSMWHSRRN